MDENKYEQINDVKWESTNSAEGEINFRNNKKRRRIKGFFNTVAIILIAAMSGGAAGAYIVYYKSADKSTNQTNQSLIQQDTSKNQVSTSDTSKNAVTKVAQTVSPAVVGISNKEEGYFGLQDSSSGSGIIIDSNGYIVTNNHVIENAAKVTVKLSSGKVLDAKVVGADQRSDLAVIKVDAKNLPVAKFGDSSKVKVGDLAIAIGNPLGEEFAGTVTAGIISALNRTIQYDGAIYKVLQTDAAINPGNSGGALCDEQGEVIGINSLKMGAAENAEGMGFAISINEAKDIIKSLMNNGKVSRPYIGISGQDVVSNNSDVQGAYVMEVVAGSGAAAAGVKPTDIIIELDGQKVTKFDDLASILDKHKVGDAVSCKLLRNGKTISVNIILSELKQANK